MADFLADDATDPWLNQAEEQPPVEAQEPAPAAPVEATQPVPEQTEETPPVEEKFNPTLYREMKEERAKRQEAERRLAELEARAPQTPQEKAKAPDPYEQPEEFSAYIEAIVEQKDFNNRLELSGERAEEKYGKPKVDEAVSWAVAEGAKDPVFAAKFRQHRAPVAFVVQEYERSRTLQTLGDKSPEDFAREYAVSQGWIVSEPGAPAPILKPSSPTPPKGLASAPGSGGVGQAPTGADWSEVKFALG